MTMKQLFPLPAGYVDENGVVQLIPREFWREVGPLTSIVDGDSCLTKPYRKKLSRMLNKKLPRRVKVMVSEQHLQAIMRELELEPE